MAGSTPFLKRRREEHSATYSSQRSSSQHAPRTQPVSAVSDAQQTFNRSVQHQHNLSGSPQHRASNGSAIPSSSRQDERSSSTGAEEIIMAMNYTDRRVIGCAYYTAQSQTLHVMEDLKLGDSSIAETLRMSVNPTSILIPANCPSELVKILDPGEEDPEPKWSLQHRPSAEFNYDAGKSKLLNLQIDQEDGPKVSFVTPDDLGHIGGSQQRATLSRQGQLFRISTWVDIESKVTVGCAGAILSHIRQRRHETYLPGDRAAATMYHIAIIEMFSLAETLLVSTDALYALQIMSTESHPNAQQQGPPSKGWSGGAKEGLSVFGLFRHHTKTPQGRMLLRQYFLRPSTDLTIINARLDTVETLLRPDNSAVLQQLSKILSKVKNMRLVMDNLRKGGSGTSSNRAYSGSIWASIRLFAYNALCVLDALKDLQLSAPLLILQDIENTFDSQKLAEIGRLVSNVIDLESSQEEHKTVVHSGIDEKLDEARRVYAGIEDLLSKVAEYIADSTPAELEANINVIFFPQIGFLISVRIDTTTGVVAFEGLDEDAWERMFTSETTAYYKNGTMRSLDVEYGDVYGTIADREIEIVQALAERVLKNEDLLVSVSDLCGRLDCLAALAQGAAQYNLQRPDVTDHNVVEIENGRHILQERTVPVFVPNPTSLKGGTGEVDIGRSLPDQRQAPAMLILTGPNYSGKSVYLKQVALIVYMAHVGSFVPASRARIGLTDKILTRITTRESLSKTSSAFMTDLQQICTMLNQATCRSLLVIDEFGKGTESEDGAGLAAGVFQHLIDRGSETPKILVATHYHELFENGFLEPQPGLRFAHMDVRLDERTDQQITYLYTYKEGRSVQSFGTCCASMNGIPTAVVERAENLLLIAAKCGSLVEACAEMPASELAELEVAEHIAKDFLEAERMDGGRSMISELLERKLEKERSTILEEITERS